MFPLSDENPTLRRPLVTLALLLVLVAVWVLVQGAGLDFRTFTSSLCEYGLIPGRLTGRLAAGTTVPLGETETCRIAGGALRYWTLFTSMFLHGSWGHLIGNGWFLWVFGNNIEDSMGRLRFVLFYVICGLVAAVAQVALDPGSMAPMVGASGAISGVMGGYLVLYPRVRVKTLLFFFIFIRIISVPAWVMLVYWFVIQLLTALPQLGGHAASSGVAVVAHVGGFLAGCLLVTAFKNPALIEARKLSWV
jgi:membrane associated rhomboid family serine protease